MEVDERARSEDPESAATRSCEITSTAICGSDLHLYNGFMPDDGARRHPGPRVHGRGRRSRARREERRRSAIASSFPSRSPAALRACQARAVLGVRELESERVDRREDAGAIRRPGIFGYSHLPGGFAGGQAEYARVPFADVGPLKIAEGLTDEQVLFLSDILPTGYMGAEMCGIKPGDTVAVWGCGPVGQFAIASAYLLGAERVIAHRSLPVPARHGAREGGRDHDQLRGSRQRAGRAEGPDRRPRPRPLHRRGRHGGHSHGLAYMHDRVKQMMRMQTDRPIALREAILSCRNGGTVSVIGVYGGLIDKFPMNAVMNRSLTIRTGQCHVHRYMKPLLERIQKGEIDPTFVITHRLRLEDAAERLRRCSTTRKTTARRSFSRRREAA